MASSSQRKVRVLYIIIVILLLASGFMGYRLYKAEAAREKSFTQGVELKSELDKVMDEYTTVKMENQDLSAQMSEKDSIILANKAEIEKLIATQADYNKIRRKLELLRKITQEYVVRIDSLVVANQALTEENTQMKETVDRFQQQNTRLEADKVQLQEKITEASVLQAYDIHAQPVRLRADGKEIATDRARRVTRISLRFNLNENKLTEPGPRPVYVRVSRPDGVVMTLGSDAIYTFNLKGETLSYTMKEEIDYRNAVQEVKMHWDRRDTETPAMSGRYEVRIYMDGEEIGQSEFSIRD